MTDSAREHDQSIERALDQAVLQAVRPLATVLVVIFLVFIGFNLVDLPRQAVAPVVFWDAVLVVCFFGIRQAHGRGLIPPAWAHAVVAGIAVLVVSNILLAFYLLAEPFYTTYILIVVLGGGFFLLSARWLTALTAAILLSWAAVAWLSSTPQQFVHYGFTLFAASTLSFVVHTVRIRTFRRLERLRLVDELRKQELEQALGAAERELMERRVAEGRYRHLVQGIEAIVWEAEVDTWRLTFVSDYAEEVLGFSTASWLESADGWLRFLHPEDRRRAEDFCRGWQRGEQAGELECRAVRADDAIVWLRVIVSLVGESAGKPPQFRGLMVDVTQRRRQEEQRAELEAQLMHAQKMEAIGRLAGGVAHDMNNMLAAIMNFASALHEEMDPQSKLQQDVMDILKACQRGRALTQNLLGVARKGTLRKEPLNLNRAVEQVVELLHRTISKQILVRVDLQAGLPPIDADPNQLQQALINLSLNAADAMQGEGTLTFTTRTAQLGREALGSSPEQPAGIYATLTVADTGVGMDEEVLQHAFEPFFTTKPTGEGTGLGLSMVYGTVTNHGGRVSISSRPGQGTAVTIKLPVSAAVRATAKPKTENERGRLSRGTGTILLVDDEELVRKSGQRLLELLGYDVLTAENGHAAVRIFRDRGETIDLVLLDLMMPEMNGHETYLRLKEIRPSVKVVFCSGFTEDQGTGALIADPETRFIRKPFDVDRLATELSQVIALPLSRTADG